LLAASITGTVFIDADRDGKWDSGEPGAANRTIYVDLNNNTKLDASEPRTTTNSAGRYSLTAVPVGTLKVRQILQSGDSQTAPANQFGRNVIVKANQTTANQNFGLVPPPATGSLKGTVFADLDGDGSRDIGESGMAGRMVYLDLNNSGALETGEPRTTTNAAGEYRFDQLSPGKYKIRVQLDVAARQTWPLSGYGHSKSVASGQTRAGIDFGAVEDDNPLRESVARVFAYAVAAANRTMSDIGKDANTFVERTRVDGTWKTVNASHWTAGFLAGTMWQIYNFVGNSTWRANATKWTTSLASQTNQTGDLAFKFLTSYLPLYQSSNDPAHRNVLLAAAASKNAQWNNNVGAFRTTWFTTRSGNPRANFAVLMDMTTDMELLMWAGRETNNQQYISRAIAHTQKVIANQVRPDGSISQFGMYDAANGDIIMQETYQGYSNSSTWSRGQAWAILSFTTMARETGRADFTAAAKKVADYFINHLPADNVPFWDFNHPSIPNTFKDSSAAAVAASGLLELSTLMTDSTERTRYRAAAERILLSLVSPTYWAAGTIHRGLLQHGAVNIPNDEFGRDNSIIYGDYYFLKAMNQYRALLD